MHFLMQTSLSMTVDLWPHPLSWHQRVIGVESLPCPEEERPIVGHVSRADEKHAGALRKEIVVKG